MENNVNNVSNVNVKKLLTIGGCVVAIGAVGFTGYKLGQASEKQPTKIVTTVDNIDEKETETTETVEVETEAVVEVEETEEVLLLDEEPEYTELNVEDFEKLVDKVEAANKEVGFNVRRENLELAVYINNINLATPELAQKIESRFKHNEEDMINTYLNVMTSYNNDMLEYYNGEDNKYADESLMFLDKLDKETVKYVTDLFEGLKANMNNEDIELTLPKFNMMVKDIMAKNEELGIEISQEAIEVAVYQRNIKNVNDDVKAYIAGIKLGEGVTLESVDEYVLNVYKRYNQDAKKQFNLSNFYYQSYYIELVVDELEGYMRENNTILGYTKDQLTIGGLFTVKMKTDDALAYFATTGFANEFEDRIAGIAEANLTYIVSRTYAALGSEAAMEECEDKKTATR